MSRLQSEFQRLYLPAGAAGLDPGAPTGELVTPEGTVRALVLELVRPAPWEALAGVWRGVQAELELPAPAIAVSGTDGFQLWFSLAEPVPAARARAFLTLLCRRFLPDVAAKRVSLWPALDAKASSPVRHARCVPARQDATGNWSAFVAPDLAPVFSDTPWLDIPPGDEGQADLLCRLASIQPAAFATALEQLAPPPTPPGPSDTAVRAPNGAQAGSALPTGSSEARRFLRRVMNDDTVALALRIEAAKALLPYGADPDAAADR